MSFVAAGLIMSVIAGGCGFRFEKEVEFTFENRTDVALCFEDVEEPSAESLCTEIAPHGTTSWLRGCGGGKKSTWSNQAIPAIIAARDRKLVIYSYSATCGEWDESSRRFVIEEQGDKIAVTDSPFHPAGASP